MKAIAKIFLIRKTVRMIKTRKKKIYNNKNKNNIINSSYCYKNVLLKYYYSYCFIKRVSRVFIRFHNFPISWFLDFQYYFWRALFRLFSP